MITTIDFNIPYIVLAVTHFIGCIAYLNLATSH